MTTKPKRVSDDVMLELSRISSAQNIARRIVGNLRTNDDQTRLLSLLDEIRDAQHEAFKAVVAVRKTLESV